MVKARLFRLGVGFALCASAAQSAWADQTIEQTLAADPLGVVRIHSPRGDLTVKAWDKDEVKVEGEVDDLAEAFEFERSGKRTVISVLAPRRNLTRGDGSDLVVHVPQTSALTIDATSTDIDVEAVTGAIAIRTVSGDVDVDDAGELTHIKTVSGDVDVEGAFGKLLVFTTGGDLDIDAAATEVVVDTMNGDIELKLEAFRDLRANSVNGTLEIDGHLASHGQLKAKTVNSSIELELHEPLDMEIYAASMGEISNDLTEDRPQQSGPRWVLRTVTGQGSSQVVVGSVNGEIEIH